MLEFVQKLAAKPKDTTIRIVRISFALVLTLAIILGWNSTLVEYGLPDYLKWILFTFPFIGLVRGLFDPGIFRRKIWKWVLVGVASTMILLSLFLIEDTMPTNTPVVPTISGELDLSVLVSEKKEASFTVSTDFWVAFLGWILLINALLLNNKNITTKNDRYGEKVTKIRV